MPLYWNPVTTNRFISNSTSSQSISMAATPPPAGQSNREILMRQKKGAPFKFLVPLIYAPLLPLIRISLRHRPVLRDRMFAGVLVGALAHGIYLVTDIYDAESK